MNYTIIVGTLGRLWLYIERTENGISWDEHIITFADWAEFFAVACSPAWVAGPFDTVNQLRVHTATFDAISQLRVRAV